MHSLDVSDGEFVLEGINDPGSAGENTASVSAPVALIQTAPPGFTPETKEDAESGRDGILSQPILFLSPPGAYQGDVENQHAGPSVIHQVAPAAYRSPEKAIQPELSALATTKITGTHLHLTGARRQH
jgi:hypothetical protein